MALMGWNETLSVKVRQFDDQHKKLIDMVNELHDAMKVGKGAQVIGGVLDALIQYTRNHFAAEEQLMKSQAYPGYEEHKKEHNQLVLTAADLQKKMKEGNAPLSIEVLTFLKDWISTHIQGMDKKYGPYLNGKGIA